MEDDYQGNPSRGCLLGAAIMCFFWAAVIVAGALWMGWL